MESELRDEKDNDDDVNDAPESTGGLDPRSHTSRILSCATCHEPVATSAWSGAVVMRCGYCGHADSREIAAPQASDDKVTAYRDTRRAEAHARLGFALGDALDGMTVDHATPERFREAVLRQALIVDAQGPIEWKRVWLGCWGAIRFEIASDPLRARMLLESALQSVSFPAYRALLLCHLAQHAAVLGATRLAKKWLAEMPAVDVAEVASERRAARALIALAKKKTDKALELVGDDTPALGYVGCATWLAYAIHLEARDRAGRPSDAILDVLRQHGQGHYLLVLTYQRAFRLAKESQQRLEAHTKRGVRKQILVAAAWAGLPILATGFFVHSIRDVVLAATFFATVAAFAQWTSFRPFAVRWPAAALTGRILVQALALVAIVFALDASRERAANARALASPAKEARMEITVADGGVDDMKSMARTQLLARDFLGAEAAAEQCLAQAPGDADCRSLKAQAQAGPFLQEP